MATEVFIAGVSSMTAALCTNPIDVIKTRLQIDGAGAASHHRVHHGSFVKCTKNVVSSEGLLALYRGVIPSLAREASYSSLRLGLYDPVKKVYIRHLPHFDETSLLVKIGAGATTGALGSAIANPCDLIKVRQQSFTGPLSGDVPLAKLIRTTIASRGIAGLWLGSAPTVIRAALLTAAQVPAYDHTKHSLLDIGFREGNLLHFGSSMVAGVVAALVTSPVDLAKTRIMNSCLTTGSSGTLGALVKIVQSEGLLALYKGFHAQWLRIGPHTTITFMIFEALRAAVGLDYL